MELNAEEIESFIDSKLLTSKSEKEKELRNEMRKQKKFCDVTLKINDKDLFQVHKNIIASSCPYFNGLFNGDWKETREDIISLDYKISAECFEIILEYMYTEKLAFKKISLENAKIVHEGAVFFNLQILKKIMSRILEKFITNENLLEMWRHGVKYFDDDLSKKCIEIISKTFSKFFTINLLELTFVELRNLHEQIDCSPHEEQICENLIDWITADFKVREKYLKDILYLINFSKISGNFIQSKILNNKTFYKNEEFVEKMMGELSNCFNIRLKTTNDMVKNKFEKLNIILISNTGIFKIDLEGKKCLPLLKHKINRENFAIHKFGLNSILISGGLNSNTCENYCPDLNLIREFPPMLEKRWKHRILALDNKIYAFGGYENDTMEIFDINSGKWSYGPKMLRPRWEFGLAEYGEVFYLMKGYSNQNDLERISTDSYDIRNEWENSPPFSCYKEIAKFVSVDSFAYVFLHNCIGKFELSKFQNYKNLKFYYDNQDKLSAYDAIKFQNEIFIFGKKLNSDNIFSGLINIRTDALTHIQIDLSECGDVGKEFHLTTAYL